MHQCFLVCFPWRGRGLSAGTGAQSRGDLISQASPDSPTQHDAAGVPVTLHTGRVFFVRRRPREEVGGRPQRETICHPTKTATHLLQTLPQRLRPCVYVQAAVCAHRLRCLRYESNSWRPAGLAHRHTHVPWLRHRSTGLIQHIFKHARTHHPQESSPAHGTAERGGTWVREKGAGQTQPGLNHAVAHAVRTQCHHSPGCAGP